MFPTKEQEPKIVLDKGFQELSAHRLSILRRTTVTALSSLLLLSVVLAQFTLLPRNN